MIEELRGHPFHYMENDFISRVTEDQLMKVCLQAINQLIKDMEELYGYLTVKQ